jgi:hypothetical protein
VRVSRLELILHTVDCFLLFHTAGLFKTYFDIGYTFRQLEMWTRKTQASMMTDTWRLMWQKMARIDWNGTS